MSSDRFSGLSIDASRHDLGHVASTAAPLLRGRQLMDGGGVGGKGMIVDSVPFVLVKGRDKSGREQRVERASDQML